MKNKIIYKGGIATRENNTMTEFHEYQEKADKYDKIVALAKEENNCRRRIKEIGQERSKLIGVVDKYKLEFKYG